MSGLPPDWTPYTPGAKIPDEMWSISSETEDMVEILSLPLSGKVLFCKFAAPFGFGLHHFYLRTKKSPKIPTKPLNLLGDLAHTVDKIFVLVYPADPLALIALLWEETLINLDYLLEWCCPLLKTIRYH
ncbi:hypothetical protein DSO57_1018081 [Entomophthora muscae]|uniref:Uncharacterized protein n=1 Tax=Entomophthora muscae TaxID=34485 RepID=A0ACC2RVH6_9FUNG|nr:hypothetical protein DSO57_1018081 [Entomophthora muscae]